jgi:hypothetical protein
MLRVLNRIQKDGRWMDYCSELYEIIGRDVEYEDAWR